MGRRRINDSCKSPYGVFKEIWCIEHLDTEVESPEKQCRLDMHIGMGISALDFYEDRKNNVNTRRAEGYNGAKKNRSICRQMPVLSTPGYGYFVKPAPGSEWHEGVKHELPYESAIPLLKIYSKMKTYAHTKAVHKSSYSHYS